MTETLGNTFSWSQKSQDTITTHALSNIPQTYQGPLPTIVNCSLLTEMVRQLVEENTCLLSSKLIDVNYKQYQIRILGTFIRVGVSKLPISYAQNINRLVSLNEYMYVQKNNALYG